MKTKVNKQKKVLPEDKIEVKPVKITPEVKKVGKVQSDGRAKSRPGTAQNTGLPEPGKSLKTRTRVKEEKKKEVERLKKAGEKESGSLRKTGKSEGLPRKGLKGPNSRNKNKVTEAVKALQMGLDLKFPTETPETAKKEAPTSHSTKVKSGRQASVSGSTDVKKTPRKTVTRQAVLPDRADPKPVNNINKNNINKNGNGQLNLSEEPARYQALSEKEMPVTGSKTAQGASAGSINARAKNLPDRWSECGQIFFTAGKAYGITPNLRTLYIGEEPDVQDYLFTGKTQEDWTYLQKEVLKSIMHYRQEEKQRSLEKEEPGRGSRLPRSESGTARRSKPALKKKK